MVYAPVFTLTLSVSNFVHTLTVMKYECPSSRLYGTASEDIPQSLDVVENCMTSS